MSAKPSPEVQAWAEDLVDEAMQGHRFLTSHEVQEELRLTSRQLDDLCSGGRIAYSKHGRGRRFDRKGLVDFLATNRTEVAKPSKASKRVAKQDDHDWDALLPISLEND